MNLKNELFEYWLVGFDALFAPLLLKLRHDHSGSVGSVEVPQSVPIHRSFVSSHHESVAQHTEVVKLFKQSDGVCLQRDMNGWLTM